MLAYLLGETRLVGVAGERFHRDELPASSSRRPGKYLERCAADARGTGSFGLKLHWDQLEPFLGLLRGLRGAPGGDAELIAAVFPQPHYVRLRRADAVAQAVSWWKARTSGAWLGGREATREPVFDFEGIDERVRRTREQDAAWDGWLAANGVEALQLTYEQVAADPAGCARRTLRFLGVEVPDDLAVTPQTLRQSDGVNEDWIRRYRETSSAIAAW
jgi:LPS sulfotransferase NodH